MSRLKVLRQRLVTAAFLIPLFVWGVISLSTYYLSLLFAFIVVLGAWEWSRLMGLSSQLLRMIFIAVVLVMLVACAWAITWVSHLELLMLVAVVWWTVALVWITRYGTAPEHEKEKEENVVNTKQTQDKIILGLVGIIILTTTWMSLVILHGHSAQGAYWLLFLMVLIWGADSGAYFAGRQWGKRKLAPLVSPGKTWEGVAGAMCVTVAVAVVAGALLDVENSKIPALVTLSIVTAMFSIVGDLFESMVKRQAGVKDSGNILPGHGGVLDRIDSITAAAPVFVLGFILQGIGA